jgi:protein N-terminal methyltransferase
MDVTKGGRFVSVIEDSVESRVALIQRIQTHLTSKFAVFCGKDTDDNYYDSIEEFWRHHGFLDKETIVTMWYKSSKEYWETEDNVPATIDGMLGGWSILSEPDLAASKQFLQEVINLRPQLSERIKSDQETRACECGAGIGRLTKGLLLPIGLKTSDLVETSPRLLQAAPQYLGRDVLKCRFHCAGLQNFNMPENTYDVIWIQWVIAYITDWDFVNFLSRMKRSLREGGIIVIKDNTCSDLAFFSDTSDTDITRSYRYLRALIEESGLSVLKDDNGKELVKWQDDFPDDIWPTPMIALE